MRGDITLTNYYTVRPLTEVVDFWADVGRVKVQSGIIFREQSIECKIEDSHDIRRIVVDYGV